MCFGLWQNVTCSRGELGTTSEGVSGNPLLSASARVSCFTSYRNFIPCLRKSSIVKILFKAHATLTIYSLCKNWIWNRTDARPMKGALRAKFRLTLVGVEPVSIGLLAAVIDHSAAVPDVTTALARRRCTNRPDNTSVRG